MTIPDILKTLQQVVEKSLQRKRMRTSGGSENGHPSGMTASVSKAALSKDREQANPPSSPNNKSNTEEKSPTSEANLDVSKRGRKADRKPEADKSQGFNDGNGKENLKDMNSTPPARQMS